MRAPIVIAVSVAGLIAGAAAVRAADLKVETSGYHGCCAVEYGPDVLVILDDEPGVTVRRWWLPPWRNRHYYPHGRWAAKKAESRPAVERKPVERRQLRRARSFARYWTNAPAYTADPAPLITRDYDPPLWRDRRYPPPPVGP